MDEYKHYIRTDANGLVILGFTSAFPEIATPQQGDLLLSGQDGRHFQMQLTNERRQYRYKVANGALAERSQAELDAEWAVRPTPPPSTEDRLAAAESALLSLMGL